MPTLAENIARNNQFHSDLRDLITENGGTIPADTPCEDLLPILEEMFGGGSSADTEYLKAMIERPTNAEIVIPQGTTGIGDRVFSDFRTLRNVSIPTSITSIEEAAFFRCGLVNITIPGSVTTLPTECFAYCKALTTVTLNRGTTTINNSAFSNCWSLTSITLPQTLNSLSAFVFESCTKLPRIKIPNSVIKINNGAFQNCSELAEIDLTSYTDPSAIPSLVNINAFSGVAPNCKFLVANSDMQAAFSSATNWSNFTFTIKGA